MVNKREIRKRKFNQGIEKLKRSKTEKIKFGFAVLMLILAGFAAVWGAFNGMFW